MGSGTSKKKAVNREAIIRSQHDTPATGFQRHGPLPKMKRPPAAAGPSGDDVDMFLVEDFFPDGDDRSSPPIKPTSKRRKDVVPVAKTFAAVDSHADSTPKSAESSVEFLSKYLCRPACNDVEKVRALYRWITHHISFATAVYKKLDRLGSQDAASVLKQGRGVSEGYANLFKEMCDVVGIPCKVILGYAKGFGYDPSIPIPSPTQHTFGWNLAFVNGDWWPMDSCWGAGTVDSKTLKFHRSFKEMYFMTDPDDFIVNHFPFEDGDMAANCSYQLLEEPLTLETFNKAIAPQEAGIEWGFTCHPHGEVIEVENECLLKVSTTRVKLEDLTFEFRDKKSGVEHSRYVLIREIVDKIFSVKITPPQRGDYRLSLFGKTDHGKETESKCMMTFVIRCTVCAGDIEPYPEHNGLWGITYPPHEYGFASDAPKTDVIEANENGEAQLKYKRTGQGRVSFSLKHSKNAVNDLNQFFYAYIVDNVLIINFRFPVSGYFQFLIVAENLADSKHALTRVGKVLIKCTSPSADKCPYPKNHATWGLNHNHRKYGIVSTSHSGDIVQSQKGVVVMKFKVKPKATFTFTLEYAGKKIKDLHRLFMSFISEGILNVKFRLPMPGFYQVMVFARRLSSFNDDASKPRFIGQYLLSCDTPSEDVRPYPDDCACGAAMAVTMDYGFSSDVFTHHYQSTSNGEIDMQFPVEPTVSAMFELKYAEDIPGMERLTFSYVQDDTLHVKVKLPKAGFYKLGLFAVHPDNASSGKYDHIGNFLLESTIDVRNIQPYPARFDKANELGFQLLEPLSGNLPANQTVRFRMTADAALSVRVNDERRTKGDNQEFDFTLTTPRSGGNVTVYGSAEVNGDQYHCIFDYNCI